MVPGPIVLDLYKHRTHTDVKNCPYCSHSKEDMFKPRKDLRSDRKGFDQIFCRSKYVCISLKHSTIDQFKINTITAAYGTLRISPGILHPSSRPILGFASRYSQYFSFVIHSLSLPKECSHHILHC